MSIMGKLFFYSDQVVESLDNRRVDELLFSGLNPKNIKIAYIPSIEDKERKYFHVKAEYYRNYGVENIMFFDLYSDFDPFKIDDLLQCDIIHLSAGNPIDFRKALQKRGMDKVLKHYFEQGGTLVGVSGGAVQLGKSTKLFQLYTAAIGDDYLEALHFVNFEFLPHYNRWTDDFKLAVHNYAHTTGTTVFAGNDGDGLIVDGDTIQMVGNILVIHNGENDKL